MITNQHIQEGLSRACIQAIAARAGFSLSKPESDYGVDGTFNEVTIRHGRRFQAGFCLHFQLKASTQWQQVRDDIVYDLEAKTYNDLIAMQTNSAIPCILILLTLPKEQERWLECSSTRVTIGGGCYWYYPSGLPTTNKQSQRINIPRQQLLTPESVIALLNKVKIGNFQL